MCEVEPVETVESVERTLTGTENVLLIWEVDVTSCVESSDTETAGLITASVSEEEVEEEEEEEEIELSFLSTAATPSGVPPKVLVMYGVEVVSSVEISDTVTVGLSVTSIYDTPWESSVDSGTTVLVVYGVDVLKTVETAE